MVKPVLAFCFWVLGVSGGRKILSERFLQLLGLLFGHPLVDSASERVPYTHAHATSFRKDAETWPI